MVAGGGDSTLRKINVSSGICTLRITLDEYKLRNTLVWAVQFIDNSTVISGDSRGKLQIWNIKHGTLRHSFELFTADVLTLAVWEGDGEEMVVYASGVDSKVVKLVRVMEEREGATKSNWIVAGQMRMHTHDVHSLSVSPSGLLASGGADTELVLTHPVFHWKSCVRYNPFPCMSRHFKIAKSAGVLLFQTPVALHLWDLTSLNPATGTAPDQLLELKAKPPLHILSSAISSDGCFIAVSNVEEMWLYRVEKQLSRVLCLAHLNDPSISMLFHPVQPQLIIATLTEGVKIIKLSEDSKYSITSLATNEKESHKSVREIQVSADGQYLAIVSSRWRISLYDLQSGVALTKLPKLQGMPVVFTFNPACPELVLFTGGGSREVFVYDIVHDALNCLGSIQIIDRREAVQVHDVPRLSNPLAIVAVPHQCNLFTVYDSKGVVMFRCSGSTRTTQTHSRKRARLEKSISGDGLEAQLVKVTPLILFVHVLEDGNQEKSSKRRKGQSKQKGTKERMYKNDGKLLVVERPWKEVINKLPPTLLRKRFGT